MDETTKINLLLKDLSARLPYGVKGRVYAEVTNGEYDISGDMIFFDAPFDVILDEINFSTEELHVVAVGNEDTIDFIEDQQICGHPFTIDEFKPYLRPLSSMTDEEETAYYNAWHDPLFYLATRQRTKEEELMLLAKAHYDSIAFLLENHFDFLGLIPLGLAIEVTEENNPYKE